MTKKDFIYVEHAKASAFNLFSGLLCQPEKKLLTNAEVFDSLRQISQILELDLADDVAQLEEAAKKYTVKELLIEYSRLFIGPFKIPAPPYSSLYLGDDSLMSDDTMWVIEFYGKTGVKFDNERIKDVPDHIAVETEFMYYMIHNEIAELDKDNTEKSHDFWAKQGEFFNKHYRKWVPLFCKKVLDETKNEYYRALFECFSKFVTSYKIPEFPVALKEKSAS